MERAGTWRLGAAPCEQLIASRPALPAPDLRFDCNVHAQESGLGRQRPRVMIDAISEREHGAHLDRDRRGRLTTPGACSARARLFDARAGRRRKAGRMCCIYIMLGRGSFERYEVWRLRNPFFLRPAFLGRRPPCWPRTSPQRPNARLRHLRWSTLPSSAA